MEQIWAPWRMQYIEGPKASGCILCQKPREDNDETNLILYRGEKNFIILNSFPYNPGHLMVAPYHHLGLLEELTGDELGEHLDMVKRCVKLLNKTLKPNGFNIGINIGKIAGAGIDDHIHTHIVPRWQGDSNFMPVLSNTKVIPEALAATYKKLKEALV